MKERGKVSEDSTKVKSSSSNPTGKADFTSIDPTCRQNNVLERGKDGLGLP